MLDDHIKKDEARVHRNADGVPRVNIVNVMQVNINLSKIIHTGYHEITINLDMSQFSIYSTN